MVFVSAAETLQKGGRHSIIAFAPSLIALTLSPYNIFCTRASDTCFHVSRVHTFSSHFQFHADWKSNNFIFFQIVGRSNLLGKSEFCECQRTLRVVPDLCLPIAYCISCRCAVGSYFCIAEKWIVKFIIAPLLPLGFKIVCVIEFDMSQNAAYEAVLMPFWEVWTWGA